MFIRISNIILIILLLYSCGEDCKFNAIKTEELPYAYVGQQYEAQITYDITCSYSTKSFELVSGNLPPGIELSRPGIISGVPSDTGSYNFRIKGRMCFSSNGFEFTDCHDIEKDIQIIVK
jgi:hypothetical protein